MKKIKRYHRNDYLWKLSNSRKIIHVNCNSLSGLMLLHQQYKSNIILLKITRTSLCILCFVQNVLFSLLFWKWSPGKLPKRTLYLSLLFQILEDAVRAARTNKIHDSKRCLLLWSRVAYKYSDILCYVPTLHWTCNHSNHTQFQIRNGYPGMPK